MDKKYIIIGRSTCPFCTQAADLCMALGIENQLLDYVGREFILEEYKEYYDQKTVPIILENDLSTGFTKKIGGYSDLLEITNGR